MTSEPNFGNDNDRDDPAFRRTRREALMILGLWTCCFLFTVTACYLRGYLTHEPAKSAFGPDIARLVGPLEPFNRQPDSLEDPSGFGIPDWVFWYIVTPWIVCVVVSIVFCLFVFHEEELGTESETGPVVESET